MIWHGCCLATGMSSVVNSLTGDSTFQSLKLSLQATGIRQDALASNLANINTPNYKRMDLDKSFQVELQNSLEKLRDDQSAEMTHVPTLSTDETPVLSRFDGNNVDLEKETVEMIKNETRHEFAAKMLTQQYGILRYAITGKGP